MTMNRNMTMAEKEVRDYAQRQMERAEQRENILFTEEQKEQVLEYAAMTGDDYDIRKMVRDLATALRSSNEKKVDEILWNAREEIDGFPDRSVGMAELKGYGYTANDMFPIRQEMALEHHCLAELNHVRLPSAQKAQRKEPRQEAGYVAREYEGAHEKKQGDGANAAIDNPERHTYAGGESTRIEA